MEWQFSWPVFGLGLVAGGMLGLILAGILASGGRSDDMAEVIDVREEAEYMRTGLRVAAARARANSTNPAEILDLAAEMDHLAAMGGSGPRL